ncbi:shikimate kinase [Thermodesulfobacteriota bacterium]
MNIFLIGYRCSGKTVVGRSLALRLNWRFIDTDEEIVKEHDRSIKEIVETEGWNSFRAKEKATLKNVCAMHQQVVATGGGIILDSGNAERMKRSGTTVWLKASPDTILHRMQQDENTTESRPSLTSKGSFAEITEILTLRRPRYEDAMDFCLDTDAHEVKALCDMIINRLEDQVVKEK